MSVEPVTNFDINPSESSFFIDFDASITPNIIRYEIWVSTDNFSTSGSNSPNFNNGSSINLNPEITSYNLGGLTNGNSYWIAVIAKTETESSSSVSASSIPGERPTYYGDSSYYGVDFYYSDIIPNSVDNVSVQQVSNRRYKISWSAPSTIQDDIAGYRVWRSENGGALDIVGTVSTSGTLEYIDRIPKVGRQYSWRITTVDEGDG